MGGRAPKPAAKRLTLPLYCRGFQFLSSCSKCSNRITLSLPGLANCLFMQLILCFTLPWLPGPRQLWSGWCRCPPGPWCRLLVRTAFRTDRPRSSGGTGPWSQPATARGTRYRTLCPARNQGRWNINQSSCERLLFYFLNNYPVYNPVSSWRTPLFKTFAAKRCWNIGTPAAIEK